jgi:hypothetical protein
MSTAHEVSSDGRKLMLAALMSTSIGTEDHSNDRQCWHNHCPSLLGVQVSCLFTEQSYAHHWNGPWRLYINQNANTCNRYDSIRRRLQWLPRRASTSIQTRKKMCPQRRRRSDEWVAMMMATTPHRHRRRRSLLKRTPPPRQPHSDNGDTTNSENDNDNDGSDDDALD